mmetsp:Transcript_74645/g.205832  ORF Transcript_74645/g.205832 Transcript_74645/m.205832 type:complete len:114 (+) Transcript_74645:423-764(+)
MPATKLASLLYFLGHRYTATHRAAGSQLVKQLQALHANLALSDTDPEDVCTEVVQQYKTYAFPGGMDGGGTARAKPTAGRPEVLRALRGEQGLPGINLLVRIQNGGASSVMLR